MLNKFFKQVGGTTAIFTLVLLLLAVLQASGLPLDKDISAQLIDALEPGKPSIEQSTETPLFPYAIVEKVTDGDTIKVKTREFVDTKQYTVRLIGINTPETVDPRREVECFGREASAFAKELLTGKKIRLEKDSTQTETDRYGRLLAYVYIDETNSFNKLMIEQGYAYEYTYDKPYIFQSEFKAAEVEAQKAGRGLWAPGACTE